LRQIDKEGKSRIIRISQRNYEILCKLGDTEDSFNDVMNRILTENNLIAVVTTEKE
jgi:hypothetical protein